MRRGVLPQAPSHSPESRLVCGRWGRGQASAARLHHWADLTAALQGSQTCLHCRGEETRPSVGGQLAWARGSLLPGLLFSGCPWSGHCRPRAPRSAATCAVSQSLARLWPWPQVPTSLLGGSWVPSVLSPSLYISAMGGCSFCSEVGRALCHLPGSRPGLGGPGLCLPQPGSQCSELIP